MLMRGLTDSVEVIQRDEGTTVQLSRRLEARPHEPEHRGSTTATPWESRA